MCHEAARLEGVKRRECSQCHRSYKGFREVCPECRRRNTSNTFTRKYQRPDGIFIYDPIERHCLSCERLFKAWDRRLNWRCGECLELAELQGPTIFDVQGSGSVVTT